MKKQWYIIEGVDMRPTYKEWIVEEIAEAQTELATLDEQVESGTWTPRPCDEHFGYPETGYLKNRIEICKDALQSIDNA